MMQILYIEDDVEISQWVKDKLIEKGYHVVWLKNSDNLLKYQSNSDIVILDVMLPGLGGFSLGKRIKSHMTNIPILMLSACTSVEDEIEGLSFADDYVTKPFHPDELIARIEVLLRRFEKNTVESMKKFFQSLLTKYMLLIFTALFLIQAAVLLIRIFISMSDTHQYSVANNPYFQNKSV